MKVNTSEEAKILYQLYLEGNTSPEQEEALFSYLRRQEVIDASFDELTSVVWENEVSLRDNSVSAQTELKSIWVAIAQEAIAEEEKEEKRSSRSASWLKYAASVVLVCTAALGWYVIGQKGKEAAQQVDLITKTTIKGEKVKLLLPDSSVVYLNALSKLRFPARFVKGENREIYLEGEAFFEVKTDASRPFIVHSGNLQTRVLGTSFNIDAYPESKTISVAVRSGKVGVSALGNGQLKQLSILSPGKNLIYQVNNSSYAVYKGTATEFNSWIDNKFIFKNELLGNILSRLARSYNVNFEVKDQKILACRFNAKFFNKNIKQITEQLQTMSSGKIHYKFNPHQTTITLWGEACQ